MIYKAEPQKGQKEKSHSTGRSQKRHRRSPEAAGDGSVSNSELGGREREWGKKRAQLLQ